MVSFFGSKMTETRWVFAFLLFCSLVPTGAFQESVELLRLSSFNPTLNRLPLAVSLTTQDLKGVASSVLVAEKWLKTHVFSHYPASKITHIVAGHNVLCAHNRQDQFGLILPSLENLYYSLTRWGLEREIKVSTSVSSECLDPHSSSYRADMAKKFKPLLEFMQSTNSTYLVNPPYPLSKMSNELHGLVSSHLICMRKLGSFQVNHIKVILHLDHDQDQTKPTSRKLSFFATKAMAPYPARPTPLPELSPSSPYITRSHLPPLIGSTSPPPFSLPPQTGSSPPPQSSLAFAPIESPVIFPPPPPFGGFHLPPCNPSTGGSVAAPVPAVVVGGQRLWCVAKPSVPAETLQEAIDFACGAGGADCAEIQPNGNCYNPNTVVAHASYALNSYWQRTKRDGGTCSFAGAAMMINADPSFLSCKFIVS